MTALMIATGLSAVTVALLLVLTGVWIQNYRAFRTTLVLGLVAFGIVLLVENAVAVYFYFRPMEMLYAADPSIGWIVVAMRALQLLAVAFLTYVTVQ